MIRHLEVSFKLKSGVVSDDTLVLAEVSWNLSGIIEIRIPPKTLATPKPCIACELRNWIIVPLVSINDEWINSDFFTSFLSAMMSRGTETFIGAVPVSRSRSRS